MKNLLHISIFTVLGILITTLSYGQYNPGTYNELGPNTNADPANHAATTVYGHSAMNNAAGGSRLTVYGAFAGENNTTGNHNNFFGHAAGRYNTTGGHNSFFGDGAGAQNTTGSVNTGFGNGTLGSLTTGNNCTALGASAGRYNETGENNITIGVKALTDIGWNSNQVFRDKSNNVAIGNSIGVLAEGDGNGLVLIGNETAGHYKGGDYNTLIGYSAGRWLGGHRNVAVGASSGRNNVGDGNIFIGYGMNPSTIETYYSNHLFIGNSVGSEFIVGDMTNGWLGINTNTPQNALDVCGKIRGNEVIIEENWCDYVFYENYNLPELCEEEQHIGEKGHLIGFQSEAAMNGEIHVADVTKRQQVKIEEMMLHLIEMDKRLKALEAENTQLKEEIKQLRSK